jgi:hypothetical protein
VFPVRTIWTCLHASDISQVNILYYVGGLQSHYDALCQSQSHIATDGQSVSRSWCRAPSRAHDQIFITVWQLRSCFFGAPSLTRGRVCLLYMLLALAIVIFLESESLGTREHILLSQIWDFPFRRLLRLTGSRWRYSTPPPHRICPVQSRAVAYCRQPASTVTPGIEPRWDPWPYVCSMSRLLFFFLSFLLL